LPPFFYQIYNDTLAARVSASGAGEAHPPGIAQHLPRYQLGQRLLSRNKEALRQIAAGLAQSDTTAFAFNCFGHDRQTQLAPEGDRIFDDHARRRIGIGDVPKPEVNLELAKQQKLQLLQRQMADAKVVDRQGKPLDAQAKKENRLSPVSSKFLILLVGTE